MNNKIILEINSLSHRFGDKHILHGINLEIERGQFVALVGPSGCGKSTLLNTIYGTLNPTLGQVLAYSNGDDPFKVTRPTRHCGMVDQSYKLYDNRTALRNVSIGLKINEATIPFRIFRPFQWNKMRKLHHDRAKEMLNKVYLEKDANCFPKEMSGGMRQRVSIAQALIMKPKVLLLDEPFGALDEAIREQMQRLLLELYAENLVAKEKGEEPPYTILFVTHGLNEAIYVSNRIIGLSQHWDWKSMGFSESPGATIVYDEPSPVFNLEQEFDILKYKAMRDQISRLAIIEKSCPEREENVRNYLERNGGDKNGSI